MQFREISSKRNLEDLDSLHLELDFVERYEDADGIVHLKTAFVHEDLDEVDLWEVFDPKDGSMSLELLLSDGV